MRECESHSQLGIRKQRSALPSLPLPHAEHRMKNELLLRECWAGRSWMPGWKPRSIKALSSILLVVNSVYCTRHSMGWWQAAALDRKNWAPPARIVKWFGIWPWCIAERIHNRVSCCSVAHAFSPSSPMLRLFSHLDSCAKVQCWRKILSTGHFTHH